MNRMRYLRHSKMKIYEREDEQKKSKTNHSLTHLPSVNVAIDVLFVDIS